jgi:hypothetical protein
MKVRTASGAELLERIEMFNLKCCASLIHSQGLEYNARLNRDLQAAARIQPPRSARDCAWARGSWASLAAGGAESGRCLR